LIGDVCDVNVEEFNVDRWLMGGGLFGMGGQTSEKKAGAQEREEEKAEIA
jgi:predicted extracellular nuclease